MTQSIDAHGLAQPHDPQRALSPLKPQFLTPRATDVTASKGGFKEMLLQSLNEVSQLRQEAHGQVEQLMAGQTDNVVEVMSAVKKAGVAFDLLMEIRNKMLEAYQELRQLQA